MESKQEKPPAPVPIDKFLAPLKISNKTVQELSHYMNKTFQNLAAQSMDQFLPTPLSETLVRYMNGIDHGKYLAIDIGGTHLRVGFVELVDANMSKPAPEFPTPRILRHLEHSWSIVECLKKDNPGGLFSWIGEKIAEVVGKACRQFKLNRDDVLPLGCAFSFPMDQQSLSQATLRTLGKGFTLDSNLELDELLLAGYEQHRGTLPPIKIAAIANDSVATLVSFIYQFRAAPHEKAAMALICGTGANATIPMALSQLHPDKRPKKLSVVPGKVAKDVKIIVNTEWSINGSEQPLRYFGLITHWDKLLDEQGDNPGFQPFEYMTSGRYLGELARLIFLEYLVTVEGYTEINLPQKLQRRFGLETTFLGHYNRAGPGTLLQQLEAEIPRTDFENEQGYFTKTSAEALYRIAVAIQKRAAGITAAATIGLLRCAGELPYPEEDPAKWYGSPEVVVGYTGGCFTGFQNYSRDCQSLLDAVVAMDYGDDTKMRVLLTPCHDGGITGAGILVPASLKSQQT